MLKVEKTAVYGWEAAIRGMRNPMNSWDRSDTEYEEEEISVGENDLDLMQRLVKAGPEHAKYLRMITVTCDVTAPLYLYKEMDTYKVGTVCNSCSTMHKIHSKEFTMEDFSCEHLKLAGLTALQAIIDALNASREDFLRTKDKEDWWQMIQLLPSSFNQTRTYQFSYAALQNIYRQRKNHKLDEWHTFCDWIRSLPYAELITQ